MRCLIAAGLLSTCLPAVHGQAYSPIRGHVIGESVAEYFSKTDGASAYLRSCQSAFTQKLARKLKVDISLCGLLADSENGLISLQIGMDAPFPSDPGGDRNTAFFAHGKLAAIHFFVGRERKILKNSDNPDLSRLQVLDRKIAVLKKLQAEHAGSPLPAAVSYEEVKRDMESRFGTPTKEDSTPFQNALGARFDYHVAAWIMSNLFVIIKELDVSADTPLVEVLLATPEEYDRQAKALSASQPDVLR